jgi:hypothetical protein
MLDYIETKHAHAIDREAVEVLMHELTSAAWAPYKGPDAA